MQVCERGGQFWSRTGCVLDRQDHVPAMALIDMTMSSEVCIFIPKIVWFEARFRVSQWFA